MKPTLLFAFLVLLLAPSTHADDTPLVHVQFTYVDTPELDVSKMNLLPASKHTAGDALANFLHIVTNAHLHRKVTVGPEITTPAGVRATLEQAHTVSGISIGKTGPDWLIGPRLALTPTIVNGDLVSVVLHLADMEIVGPSGYWFKKPEVGSAVAPPVFQAHSGSTILLDSFYSSDHLERWTFATVTILPVKSKEADANTSFGTILLMTPPPAAVIPKQHIDRKPEKSLPVPRITMLYVQINDLDIPADSVDALSTAVKDRTGSQDRLAAVLRGIAKSKQTVTVVPGIGDYNVPRATLGRYPLEGDKLSPPTTGKKTNIVPVYNSMPPITGIHDARVKYLLDQTLTLASRINSDNTATVRLVLDETPASPSGLNRTFKGGWQGGTVTDLLRFHDGETKLLADTPRPGGLRHVVYATVTLYPTIKE